MLEYGFLTGNPFLLESPAVSHYSLQNYPSVHAAKFTLTTCQQRAGPKHGEDKCHLFPIPSLNLGFPLGMLCSVLCGASVWELAFLESPPGLALRREALSAFTSALWHEGSPSLTGARKRRHIPAVSAPFPLFAWLQPSDIDTPFLPPSELTPPGFGIFQGACLPLCLQLLFHFQWFGFTWVTHLMNSHHMVSLAGCGFLHAKILQSIVYHS